MPSPRYYLGFVTVGALLAAPLKSRPNYPAPRRRPLRLPGFDDSGEGAYFVTICTRNRECLFGDVVNGKMCLNEAGRVVQTVWDGLSDRCPTIELVSFVVMPNHVHGILLVGVALAPPKRRKVGAALALPVGRSKQRPYEIRIHHVRDCGARIQIDIRYRREPPLVTFWAIALAKELLRTRHSNRGVVKPHPRVYRNQSLALAARPRESTA